MSPTRALSESAKVLAELARQLRAEEKMSLETLRIFIDLLTAYGKSVQAVTPQQADVSNPGKAPRRNITREEVEEWTKIHGRPGFYEEMVEAAKMVKKSEQ